MILFSFVVYFVQVTFNEIYYTATTTLGAETFANFANFTQIRESLRREKICTDRFAKVYAREIFQFFLQTCWLPLIMR